MEFEHFGISIVEMMATGIPVIAHNSAGAKEDIILSTQEYGFLADNIDDYVKHIQHLIDDGDLYQRITSNSKKRSYKFGTDEYIKSVLHAIGNVIKLKREQIKNE